MIMMMRGSGNDSMRHTRRERERERQRGRRLLLLLLLLLDDEYSDYDDHYQHEELDRLPLTAGSDRSVAFARVAPPRPTWWPP